MSPLENEIMNLLVCSAGLLIFGSTLGALRFPNAIIRLHATAKAGGLAASFMLLAVWMVEPSLVLFLKIVFIVLMILFTTAQAAHMIARSSLAGSDEHPMNGDESDS